MNQFVYDSTNRSGRIECDVLLTNRCNLSCRHCLYIERIPQKKDLAASDFDELLRRLEGTGAEVHLLGGEPLCREDIVDIVSEITRRGLVAKILTNGFVLTRSLMFRLKEAGLKGIGVSIDGVRESHNINRGNSLAYDRVMNALELIKESGFPTKVSCAIHSGNRDSLCPLLLELDKKGVGRILVEHVLPIGHGRQLTGQNLSPDEWRGLIEEVHEFKERNHLSIRIAIQEVYSARNTSPFRCECLSGRFPVIDESGLLYPCIILYAADASLSHISAFPDGLSALGARSTGFVSEIKSSLPQPYMHGRLEIKCPAVQRLVSQGGLNLDNVMESDVVLGCFHKVILL